MDEVKLFPEEGSLVNRFVFCILVQFAVYVILYMIAYNSNVHINILGKVKEVKFKEYDQKILDLQDKLNKLDMKEKLLR